MNNKVIDIYIKNRTGCFFNDIVSIKNFDPSKIKTHQK